MGAFFCDTSAIVKLYVSEPGTAWLTGLAAPASGNRIYVAGVTGAETVAAVTRRQRSGGLSRADADAAIASFRHDFANQFHVVAITPRLIETAMALAEKHSLRGYDAVQPAAALITQQRRLARKLSPATLVCADAELNVAAAAEGLATDDPNKH